MSEGEGEAAINPDAQTAVTDFLDYTEYLPADLIRSLTLIRSLDETYLTNSYSVHEHTKTYGSLPSLPQDARPDFQDLRYQISHHLDLALNARESAFAEASRLFDLANRHQDRLKSIIAKLKALPKPPSRDPTPQPQTATPKRSRSGRKLENRPSATRLTLKAPRGPIASGLLPRPRHRRITVPGEVMPPYDPDEPIASTEVSDWESDEPLPPKPSLKLVHPKPQKLKVGADGTERKPREPRETATYRKPTPPPADAQIGSKYLPWLELTEYEMFRLRKKMKKNHTWEPSEVMVKRELLEKGRGLESYQKAKAKALADGVPFLDARASADATPSTSKPANPKPSLTLSTAATPTPKLLKKPDSKKEKRIETPKDPASIAAHQAAQAAQKLGNIGSVFANLFSNFTTSLKPSGTPASNGILTPGSRPVSEKPSKKRKLPEASTSPPVESDSQKKKPKLVPKPSPLAATIEPKLPATTNKIALKLNINPQTATTSVASTSMSPSLPASTQRQPSVVPKTEGSPPPPNTTRPPSRRSAAASVEPTPSGSTRPSRRTSLTPAAQMRKTPIMETTPRITATAASQRPKREAPGTVTQASGGVAVSVSKRKHKPSKQHKPARLSQEVQPEVRTDVDGNQEIVDPNEQRYCVCKDVSYGEMIQCELEEKCTGGEWFHMECVGLADLPSRTVKWYCPSDRKKYHKGEATNGLVGRGVRE